MTTPSARHHRRDSPRTRRRHRLGHAHGHADPAPRQGPRRALGSRRHRLLRL